MVRLIDTVYSKGSVLAPGRYVKKLRRKISHVDFEILRSYKVVSQENNILYYV
jgi:hypothetical protein